MLLLVPGRLASILTTDRILSDKNIVGHPVSFTSAISRLRTRFLLDLLSFLSENILAYSCRLSLFDDDLISLRKSSFLWGAMLTLHAVAQNYAGLMVLRTFLGVFESAISPGFSLITGMWYTPQEHVSRHTFWFAGNASFSIIGSLIAYGIAHYHDHFPPWKVCLPFRPHLSVNELTKCVDTIPYLWPNNRDMVGCIVVLPA